MPLQTLFRATAERRNEGEREKDGGKGGEGERKTRRGDEEEEGGEERRVLERRMKREEADVCGMRLTGRGDETQQEDRGKSP